MLEELAIVVKTDHQQVWVTSGQHSACGGCQQKAACTTHAIGSLLKRKSVPVDSDMPLNIGDPVIVAIDETSLLHAALAMYLVPLIALLAGAGLADTLMTGHRNADAWIAASALGSLLLCLGLIKLTQNAWLFPYFPRPRVIKKVAATAYECLGD